MRVPPNHPFLDGIFHYEPTICGDPPFISEVNHPGGQYAAKSGTLEPVM